MTQTQIAIEALRTSARQCGLELDAEIVRISTTGDAVTDKPFEAIGPKGVFAAELQRALLDDRVDVAVHSLKDLPASEPEGLTLACVLERDDARDVLVSRDGRTLAELEAGAVVGTSSARRRALLLIHRPDLEPVPLRGNVDTRLEKVARGDVDAAILAAAGIVRLGRDDVVSEWLDPLVFVPPPGQGAVVVEARTDRVGDDLGWLEAAQHEATRACVDTERVFMHLVEGGCEVPLGAWATYDGDDLVCEGFVAAADGSAYVRETARGRHAQTVGADLARRVLDRGAAAFRQVT